MRNINWNWVYENWKVFLIIPWLGIMALVIFTAHFKEPDPELSDRSTRLKLANDLTEEMRGLELPENTSLVSVENHSKYKQSIYIFGEYRTEVSNEEFLEKLNDDLNASGWMLYGKENEREAFTTYKYCRGKFNANLSYQSRRLLWPEKYDTWKLSFTSENRQPLFGSVDLPENCKASD